MGTPPSFPPAGSTWSVGSESVLRATGPRFNTRSCHILSFLVPLIPDGQLSVTGESMCTKYWLTRFGGPSLPMKSVVRLTDHPNLTIAVYRGCKTISQERQQSFSAMFSKGDNFRDSVSVPGGQSLLKMRSSLKGMNLLQWEQILSSMRLPHFIWKATMKMTVLLPLKVYPFTIIIALHAYLEEVINELFIV